MKREIHILKREGKIETIGWIDKLNNVLSLIRNGQYTISVSRRKEKRSIPQNSLFWLWMKEISDETAQNIQDVHDYYCTMFLRRQIKIGDRIETVVGGTSKLNKDDFTEFLQKIQADAASELGMTLPIPEDLRFEEFYRDYQESLNYID